MKEILKNVWMEENNDGSCREAEGILSMICGGGTELLAAECCGL